jgi:hypothetical protein
LLSPVQNALCGCALGGLIFGRRSRHRPALRMEDGSGSEPSTLETDRDRNTTAPTPTSAPARAAAVSPLSSCPIFL